LLARQAACKVSVFELHSPFVLCACNFPLDCLPGAWTCRWVQGFSRYASARSVTWNPHPCPPFPLARPSPSFVAPPPKPALPHHSRPRRPAASPPTPTRKFKSPGRTGAGSQAPSPTRNPAPTTPPSPPRPPPLILGACPGSGRGPSVPGQSLPAWTLASPAAFATAFAAAGPAAALLAAGPRGTRGALRHRPPRKIAPRGPGGEGPGGSAFAPFELIVGRGRGPGWPATRSGARGCKWIRRVSRRGNGAYARQAQY
jgi:hypothetical protein